MRIKIIGADAAFDGLNTSLFFTDDSGRGVLVDCGFTVFPELTRRGLRERVDVALISHLHGDHTGSLGVLAVWKMVNKLNKLIIGGIGAAQAEALFIATGEHVGRYEMLASDDPLNVKTIPTGHTDLCKNNALFIADTILYSGDTNQSVLDSDYARAAKVIFHETTNRVNAAHTHLDALNAAAPEIKAKTWLVHIEESGRREIEAAAASMGFAGVCRSGQEIDIA